MENIFDETTKQRVFQQVMDIFVISEIKRRRKEGKIKEGIIISKMQIVFSFDKGRNKTKLNEEVKAIK